MLKRFISPRKRRRAVLALLACPLLLALLWPPPERWRDPGPVVSLRIEDRRGQLLREVLSDSEGRARWLPLADIPSDLVAATLCSEDRRFYRHPGLDPLAVLRAVVQNIRARRIVSGGSTITQQLARALEPRRRSLLGKLGEAWTALRLEIWMTKDEIIEQYLNRIPYGNQTFGIEAAARLYFGKPADHLSLAESAFLAVLPRAPTAMDPYRREARAVRAQRALIQRMEHDGFVTPEEARRALNEPLRLVPANRQFRAPHFCDWLLAELPISLRHHARTLRTTIDAELEAEIERRLAKHVQRLEQERISQAACVVLDARTGEILAMAGSRDFFAENDDGQVNGATALRQPGSSLKPFTYALAMERRLAAPATVIADIETRLTTEGGLFQPVNYDRDYHGPVRLRQALACSYNVPAVRVAALLGTPALLDLLRQLGFDHLTQTPTHYGLGLTLGNGEVQLLENVRAYSSLASGGVLKSARAVHDIRGPDGRVIEQGVLPPDRRIFSPEVSFMIGDILADPVARMPAFGRDNLLELPFWCAVKTGTTKDYRDNWTLGYTPEFCAGVWAGNFDGSPSKSISGAVGAAPLLHDVFMLLYDRRPAPAPPTPPPGLERRSVCLLSGEQPTEICQAADEWFFTNWPQLPPCTYHRVVRIDARNGLLAPPGCDGPEIEPRVFVVPPVEYRAWALEKGIPTVPQKISPLYGQAPVAEIAAPPPGRPPVITVPEPDAIYKIDPVLRREFQSLTFRGVFPEGTVSAIWTIDGNDMEPRSSPFQQQWTLVPGTHTVVARAIGPWGETASAQRSFRVLP